MIKRITLLKRLAGTSHQDFVRYWLGPHADIAREIPALRICINVTIDADSQGWDGFSEVWFTTREAADAAYAAEPLRSRLAEDRAKFVGEAITFYVEEHPLRPA